MKEVVSLWKCKGTTLSREFAPILLLHLRINFVLFVFSLFCFVFALFTVTKPKNPTLPSWIYLLQSHNKHSPSSQSRCVSRGMVDLYIENRLLRLGTLGVFPSVSSEMVRRTKNAITREKSYWGKLRIVPPVSLGIVKRNENAITRENSCWGTLRVVPSVSSGLVKRTKNAITCEKSCWGTLRVVPPFSSGLVKRTKNAITREKSQTPGRCHAEEKANWHFVASHSRDCDLSKYHWRPNQEAKSNQFTMKWLA